MTAIALRIAGSWSSSGWARRFRRIESVCTYTAFGLSVAFSLAVVLGFVR